jgi:hypothetical protein
MAPSRISWRFLIPVLAVVLIAPGTAHASATLGLGSKGPAVRALQQRLAWATYMPWGPAIDGHFGTRTWHAVVAYQGWNGLSRDGVVGPATQASLAHARRPRAWSGTSGFEIHLAQQVVLLVRERRVERAIHVSTGRPGYNTPTGFFRVYRREFMSWSVPFQSWMPLAQYFHGGYALHEYGDVPAYPASHGCVRVPAAEARAVWNFGYIGLPVRVLSR